MSDTVKATIHCEHDYPFWHYTDEDGMGGCKGATVIELTWLPRGAGRLDIDECWMTYDLDANLEPWEDR